MEKNNSSSSSSSVCTKIRHALASNPALRAIHRISSFNQEPKPVHVTKSNGSNSPPPRSKTTSVQTKPPPHHKAHTETSTGAIPIKFDYSTPIENGNSKGSSTHHVGNSTKVAAIGEPPQHGDDRVHSSEEQQQGKESVDINDTFKEFIQRAKKKMRTVSNIGRGQNQRNPAAAAAPDHHHEVHHGTTKNENLEDTFQDFIHRAKKKIRTNTLVGKSGSLRRD